MVGTLLVVKGLITKLKPLLPILTIAAIVAAASFFAWKGVEKIEDIIEARVNAAHEQQQLEFDLLLSTAQLKLEKDLSIKREEAEKARLIFEEKKAAYDKKVSSLSTKLQSDHDLDRLLQAKPKMIEKRVNNGTKQYYEELEEATK